MTQIAAIATVEAAPARRPSRLAATAIVLAAAVLLAGFVVIGYPLAIVLGLLGTGAFLMSIVVLTAADLFGRS